MAGASPLSSSTQQNISQHQKAIYEDGELDEEATRGNSQEILVSSPRGQATGAKRD